MRFTPEELRAVRQKAADVRADILEMLPAGKTGHIGGSCSAADFTAALYFKHMRVYDDPKDPRRDRCIFSKGHAVLAQYACLAELGYIERAELKKVKTLDGVLQGHPDMGTPGIEAVTGSLGQGLSVGLGIALGFKQDGNPARVYVVLGDGEIAEGQIWEAAMAAAAYKADNLCAILDWNGVQATEATDTVFPIRAFKEKWSAFGWNTLEVDGHDVEAVLDALDEAQTVKGRPSILLAHTVKGKGLPFAEGLAKFHNAAMTAAEHEAAAAAVARMREEV